MRTRKLGSSELELTTVGLGAWAIGGPWEFGWGPQDDNDSIKTIHTALDGGINWIDTAPAYGHGRSETIVGKVLKELNTKPIIATKCGIVWDETHDKICRLDADSIRNECHQSLKRLGIETIDIYHMHWPEPEEQIEEGVEAMAKLQKEGKIRYIGVSNFNVEQVKNARTVAEIVSLQPPYSMLHRDIEEQTLPYCADNNIGVVVYSPMQKGLLTGKYTKEKIADLAKDDHRRRDPDFKDPAFSATQELIEGLKPIAERHDITLAQLAVAWVLRRKELTAAIVGARKPEQARENPKSSDVDLSKRDIDEIENLLRRRENKLQK